MIISHCNFKYSFSSIDTTFLTLGHMGNLKGVMQTSSVVMCKRVYTMDLSGSECRLYLFSWVHVQMCYGLNILGLALMQNNPTPSNKDNSVQRHMFNRIRGLPRGTFTYKIVGMFLVFPPALIFSWTISSTDRSTKSNSCYARVSIYCNSVI